MADNQSSNMEVDVKESMIVSSSSDITAEVPQITFSSGPKPPKLPRITSSSGPKPSKIPRLRSLSSESTSELPRLRVLSLFDGIGTVDLTDDDPDEPIPSTSKNVLKNGLKRPLPDGVDCEKKKKFRLIELSDDELEVTNKDDCGKYYKLLIQTELENTSVDESNVSNKIEKKLSNMKKSEILVNIFNKPDENFNDSCELIGNSKDIVKNGINVLTKNDVPTSNGISCLNKSSSSDNLAITENSDQKNVAVVNDIQVTENISKAVNDSTVRESNSNLPNTKTCTVENIVNSKKNDAEPLLEFKNKIHLTKNTDETTSIESPCSSNTNNSKKVDVCSNDIDQEFEVIDSDDSSDVSSSDLTDLPDKPVDIDNITLGVKKVSKESFQELLKLFSSKELTYDQFDSMCTQKIIEMMTVNDWGDKERSELQLLKKREKIWQSKYSSLHKQFQEMKTIVNVHKQELQSNEFARPHIVTRTVGLQAVSCPKKEGSMKLPKQAIPFSKPDPISIIIEDDDDDVVMLEFETAESSSPSTSKITNTTTKKQMPPLVSTSRTLVVSPKNVTASPKNVTASPKTVTAAKPLNPINIDTTIIDLTGDDDVIEESNIINLEDSISPVKIPRRIAASLLPAGTLVVPN